MYIYLSIFNHKNQYNQKPKPEVSRQLDDKSSMNKKNRSYAVVAVFYLKASRKSTLPFASRLTPTDVASSGLYFQPSDSHINTKYPKKKDTYSSKLHNTQSSPAAKFEQKCVNIETDQIRRTRKSRKPFSMRT